jgi:hypothetical protein
LTEVTCAKENLLVITASFLFGRLSQNTFTIKKLRQNKKKRKLPFQLNDLAVGELYAIYHDSEWQTAVTLSTFVTALPWLKKKKTVSEKKATNNMEPKCSANNSAGFICSVRTSRYASIFFGHVL